MALKSKLLLIVLDGVPYRNWRRLMGNLEGWAQSGEAHSPWLSISLPPCASTATKSGSPQSAIRNSRLQPCPDSLVRLFPWVSSLAFTYIYTPKSVFD